MGECTRMFKQTKAGQSPLGGAQSLDQRWRWMKAYLPNSINGKVHKYANPAIDSYVYSYQFRVNATLHGGHLWPTIGKLVPGSKTRAA